MASNFTSFFLFGNKCVSTNLIMMQVRNYINPSSSMLSKKTKSLSLVFFLFGEKKKNTKHKSNQKKTKQGKHFQKPIYPSLSFFAQ